MPMTQRVLFIEPTDQTHYLVGPEGLVWTQPAIGEPFIIAADNEEDRKAASDFIAGLLGMGLVPYGVPLNHRQNIAMFGGSATRDCRWVHHSEASAPTGDEGDELPTKAAIIMPLTGKRRSEQIFNAAMGLVEEFGIEKLDDMSQPARKAQLASFAHLLAEQMECHIETARIHIAKACRRMRHPDWKAPERGGSRPGAGRPAS